MVTSWLWRKSDRGKDKKDAHCSSGESTRLTEGSSDDSSLDPRYVGHLGSDASFPATQKEQRDARFSDLRYTKFTIKGQSQTSEKHAVFIPDTLMVKLPLFKEICDVIEKQAPSMLLSGISSVCHTSRLSNKELRKCQGFSQFVSEAQSCVKSGEKNPNSNFSGSDVMEVVDKILEKRVRTTVSCIATAAQRTNAWTYTGPQITNFEMCLQRCIEGGQVGAFHMVATHMQDKSYMECPEAKQMMKRLLENSQPLTHEGISWIQPVILEGDLWDPNECKTSAEFKRFGYDYWSFDSFEQREASGHPITLWPWPHGNLYLFFYREKGAGRPGEAEWRFKTPRKLAPESVPFDPELLAPWGHVVFGAPVNTTGQSKKLALRGMKVSRPVVLVDNTPNVAKQLCLCVNAIKRVWERAPLATCKTLLDDSAWSTLSSTPTSAELIQALSPSKILMHVKNSFDSSGMDDQEKLTLGDVVGLLDVAKRRPRAFRETVCVLDPQAQTSESVAHLVSTFMSHQTGLKETNPRTVDHSLILKAWGVHSVLVRSERKLRRLVVLIEAPIVLALVSSICLAVAMVPNFFQEALSWNPPEWLHRVCDMALVSSPVTVALLAIVRNNVQVSKQWVEAHMACNKIVREIYLFLGSVGPYGRSGPVVNQKRFLYRLKKVVKGLSGPWLRGEDLGTQYEEDFRDDPEKLQDYVNRTLYGNWHRGPCCSCRCLRAIAGSCYLQFPWTRLLLDEEPTDMAAPVTAESYMEIRMLPLRDRFSRMSWSLWRTRIFTNVVLVLLLAATMGMGAIGVPLLIPVVVCLAALLACLLYWVSPCDQEKALEEALQQINSFIERWQGPDIVENRTLATKVNFIVTTEQCALRVARSVSPYGMLPELTEEDENLQDLAEPKAEHELLSTPIRITVTSS